MSSVTFNLTQNLKLFFTDSTIPLENETYVINQEQNDEPSVVGGNNTAYSVEETTSVDNETTVEESAVDETISDDNEITTTEKPDHHENTLNSETTDTSDAAPAPISSIVHGNDSRQSEQEDEETSDEESHISITSTDNNGNSDEEVSSLSEPSPTGNQPRLTLLSPLRNRAMKQQRQTDNTLRSFTRQSCRGERSSQMTPMFLGPPSQFKKQQQTIRETTNYSRNTNQDLSSVNSIAPTKTNSYEMSTVFTRIEPELPSTTITNQSPSQLKKQQQPMRDTSNYTNQDLRSLAQTKTNLYEMSTIHSRIEPALHSTSIPNQSQEAQAELDQSSVVNPTPAKSALSKYFVHIHWILFYFLSIF